MTCRREALTFTIPTTIDANVASEVTGSALGPVAAVMWAAGHTVQVMPAADSVALPLPVQPTPLPTTTATAPTITPVSARRAAGGSGDRHPGRSDRHGSRIPGGVWCWQRQPKPIRIA